MLGFNGHKVDPELAVRSSLAEVSGLSEAAASTVDLTEPLGQKYIRIAPMLAGRLKTEVSHISGLGPRSTGQDLLVLAKQITHSK